MTVILYLLTGKSTAVEGGCHVTVTELDVTEGKLTHCGGFGFPVKRMHTCDY